MATNHSHLNSRAALARLSAYGAALAAAASFLSSASQPVVAPAWIRGLDEDELELVGYTGHLPDSKKPKVTAYFVRESYPRGGTARLVISDSAQDVTVQL